MPEPLETIYPKIGRKVLASVPAPWDEVNIHVSLKPGVIQLKGSALVHASNEARSFAPDWALAEMFQELHERMVKELKDDWTSAEFKLKHNGKFEIKFGYDQ